MPATHVLTIVATIVYTIVSKEKNMDFLSVRELRASSRNIWRKLSEDGKMVITNNGKPAALLLDLSNEDLEDTLLTLRQAKAIRLFNRMRAEAEKRGFLSEEEIEAEIRSARADMKAADTQKQ
jgi:PHD/YefM family antitoxin component YafN of YafNO toxin-antitoxin module